RNRPSKLALLEGQAPRGEEPEGQAARQVQRGCGGDRLSGSVAAGRGGGGNRVLRPRTRRKSIAVGRRRSGRAAGRGTDRRDGGMDVKRRWLGDSGWGGGGGRSPPPPNTPPPPHAVA